jgi:hypothetical protein
MHFKFPDPVSEILLPTHNYLVFFVDRVKLTFEEID